MDPNLPQNITNLSSKASDLTSQAGQFAAGTNTIGDELKQRVSKLFNDNQDILHSFSTSVGNLVAAPNQAAKMFAGVRDPFARQGLIGQFVGDQTAAPIAYGGLLNQRIGSQADTVNAGVNAYKAKAETLANAASAAQQDYQNAFDQWKTQQELANARAANRGLNLNLGNTGTDTGTPATNLPAFSEVLARAALNPGGGISKDIYIDDNEYYKAFQQAVDGGYDPTSVKNALDSIFVKYPKQYVHYTAPSGSSAQLNSFSLPGAATNKATANPALGLLPR